MNYYPFHIGDYLSATRHLSWEEDAAFRRLLDTYYTTEKPLPLEPRAVCRLVLATTDSQREAVRVVLEEFFEQTPEGWVNRRADAEIEAMREKQAKQRAKANKRWGKPVAEPGIAPALPRHEETDAAASKTDADAMPPTPTPTPKKEQQQKTAPKGVDLLAGIDPQIAADFKALRLKLRAPITKTAFDGIRREAAKAGLSVEAALAICCERGWRGFKADWVHESRNGNGAHRESPAERVARINAEAERRGSNVVEGEFALVR